MEDMFARQREATSQNWLSSFASLLTIFHISKPAERGHFREIIAARHDSLRAGPVYI